MFRMLDKRIGLACALVLGDDQVAATDDDLFRKSLDKHGLTSMLGGDGVTTAVEAHLALPISLPLYLLAHQIRSDRVAVGQAFLAKQLDRPLFSGSVLHRNYSITSLIGSSRCKYSNKEKMNNESIARRFQQLATLMEIRGDDPFRLRSYRNASEAIETWPESVAEIARTQGLAGLQDIPGVGKAIAGKIVDLVERGTFDAWEKLTSETPATVLELLEIPGIGPKTAALLHNKFKITSRNDLKEFVAGGGLEQVDGIGPKTAERIRAEIGL